MQGEDLEQLAPQPGFRATLEETPFGYKVTGTGILRWSTPPADRLLLGSIEYATISGTIYAWPIRIAPDVVVDITDPLYDARVGRCGPVARNLEGAPW